VEPATCVVLTVSSCWYPSVFFFFPSSQSFLTDRPGLSFSLFVRDRFPVLASVSINSIMLSSVLISSAGWYCLPQKLIQRTVNGPVKSKFLQRCLRMRERGGRIAELSFSTMDHKTGNEIVDDDGDKVADMPFTAPPPAAISHLSAFIEAFPEGEKQPHSPSEPVHSLNVSEDHNSCGQSDTSG